MIMVLWSLVEMGGPTEHSNIFSASSSLTRIKSSTALLRVADVTQFLKLKLVDNEVEQVSALSKCKYELLYEL